MARRLSEVRTRPVNDCPSAPQDPWDREYADASGWPADTDDSRWGASEDLEQVMARLFVEVRAGVVRVFDDGDEILDATFVAFEWRKGETPILCVERPGKAKVSGPASGTVQAEGSIFLSEVDNKRAPKGRDDR